MARWMQLLGRLEFVNCSRNSIFEIGFDDINNWFRLNFVSTIKCAFFIVSHSSLFQSGSPQRLSASAEGTIKILFEKDLKGKPPE